MQIIQIFVKLVKDHTRAVGVGTSETVQKILMRKELQEHMMGAKDCYLIFDGKRLHNSSTVSECGIRSCSMLHMATRLHGGMQKTVCFIRSDLASRHPESIIIRTYKFSRATICTDHHFYHIIFYLTQACTRTYTQASEGVLADDQPTTVAIVYHPKVEHLRTRALLSSLIYTCARI